MRLPPVCYYLADSAYVTLAILLAWRICPWSNFVANERKVRQVAMALNEDLRLDARVGPVSWERLTLE